MRACSRVTEGPRLCGAAPRWHKDGSTRPAEVKPLDSVWGLSLEASRVRLQAARLSHSLAHGLASLTVMRGLSAARRCSAAGCAALRRLYVRCRRSAPLWPLCSQVRPAAADCCRLRYCCSASPIYRAALRPTVVSCAAPALLWVTAARLRSTALLPLRPTTLLHHRHASAAPPRHLSSPGATAAPSPTAAASTPLRLARPFAAASPTAAAPTPPRLTRPCAAAAPVALRRHLRRAHGAAAALTPLRLTCPCAAAATTALRWHRRRAAACPCALDPPMCHAAPTTLGRH